MTSMMAVVLLFGSIILGVLLANKAEGSPLVACSPSKDTCEVEFQLDDGSAHRVTLRRETQSVFARDAVIEGIEGSIFNISDRKRFGERYHSDKTEAVHRLAAALIDVEKHELVEGIFATKSHGIIEWGSKDDNGSIIKRRLSALSSDHDLVLENPLGSPWMDASNSRIGASSSSWDPNATPFGQIIPFFPSCYSGDTVTHAFKMNLVYDNGLFNSLASAVIGDINAKTSKILSDLETLFGFGKLIFLVQLNVRIELQRVIFGQPTDPIPLSRGGPSVSCTTAIGAMNEFMDYINKANAVQPTGYWLLLSNCFSGVNGVSYIGSICGNANNGGVAAYSWPVLFHELGHGFGMSHSFENGVGLTGGLMDYGDPSYNGAIQFHPNKRSEVCPFLDYIKSSSSSEFFQPVNANQCGDGILTRYEECECLNQGTTNCAQCVNCKLTSAAVQCSTMTFVVRNSAMPDTVIVDASALSDTSCCVKNRLASPKTLCGTNNLNVCSAGGKCEKVCTKLLFSDNRNCGFDASGCQLGCMWDNKCRFDMIYSKDDGSMGLISGVPDGTSCILPSGKTGLCSDARCVTSLPVGTSPPLSIPDEGAPTSSQPATLTHSPTVVNTARPSIPPTSPPTLRPSTPQPTRRTSSPTIPKLPKATKAEIKRCAKFKAIRRCLNRRCGWCPKKKPSCQPLGTC